MSGYGEFLKVTGKAIDESDPLVSFAALKPFMDEYLPLSEDGKTFTLKCPTPAWIGKP